MDQLTSHGQRVVAGLASKHGFSEQAVTHMLMAVRQGNGAMAQFNHPEFAGAGQWMRGGMLMLSDMFNHALKARVDALCSDIGDVLANEPELLHGGSYQTQTQSGGGRAQASNQGSTDATSVFVPQAGAQWWPAELGRPNATGSQNHVRYAYFAQARRLAVEAGGRVRVYDTLDHQIAGFSQQQGGGSSVVFTSQHGTVSLSSLPELTGAGGGQAESAFDITGAASDPATHGVAAGADEVFAAIERLGKLRDGGLLSDEEFAEKKAELLRRI